jgi:hypothetical protein
MLTWQVRVCDIAINETSLTNIVDETRIFSKINDRLCRLVGQLMGQLVGVFVAD